MEPYRSLTVHFIDDDFKLQAKCLAIAYFPGQHTGKLIFCACGLNFPKFPAFALVSIEHIGMF